MQATPSTDHFYTAGRLHRMLAAWPEIIALSETPASARNLVRPGPTAIEPHVARSESAADPMRWCDVVADVQAAHKSLASGGPGKHCVAAALAGEHPESFAARYGAAADHIMADYRRAVGKMHRFLEPDTGSSAVCVNLVADDPDLVGDVEAVLWPATSSAGAVEFGR